MEVEYEQRHCLQDDEDDVEDEDGPEFDVVTSLAVKPGVCLYSIFYAPT